MVRGRTDVRRTRNRAKMHTFDTETVNAAKVFVWHQRTSPYILREQTVRFFPTTSEDSNEKKPN
jgi:hypothetical protein